MICRRSRSVLCELEVAVRVFDHGLSVSVEFSSQTVNERQSRETVLVLAVVASGKKPLLPVVEASGKRTTTAMRAWSCCSNARSGGTDT